MTRDDVHAVKTGLFAILEELAIANWTNRMPKQRNVRCTKSPTQLNKAAPRIPIDAPDAPDFRDSKLFRESAKAVMSLVDLGEFVTVREIKRRIAEHHLSVSDLWLTEILDLMSKDYSNALYTRYGLAADNLRPPAAVCEREYPARLTRRQMELRGKAK